MTTYRTLLQAGAHPRRDPRRAADLRAYLRRLATALTPHWAPTEGRDDVGSALLQIAARLGEETTRRLDRTAERDAAAFFDFLGLPPTPPRAATGVLAMALAEETTLPVFAGPRTQVSVTGRSGDVLFETRTGLRVVPGRIAEVIAVDPAADRVELAPAQVSALERPSTIPATHEVVTFAGAGSRTLQLSPAVGLVPEDVLRIGSAAYRIAELDANTGIVTLQDALEAPAAAGATVTRVGSFEAFDLRDLQRHAFHVAHAELFDLKQRAEISLTFTPPELARELAALDVTYSMFGTNEGDPEPAWHPLELLGTTGATLRLAKPDVGSVDEVEVHGRKSRWLRAELPGPVSRVRSLSSPASGIGLAVASTVAAGTDPAAPAPDPEEGSRTIALASHNGTPLSTARRFFPFGPEPLRFDVFALAAPEALSKKGATVTLDVTMVDSSLAVFDITAVTAADGRVRGYGVGRNGDLQALSFPGDVRVRWHSLEAVDGQGRRHLLSNAVAVGVAGDVDVVVATDRAGGLLSATIRPSGDQAIPTVDTGKWQALPVLASSGDQVDEIPNGRPPGPVVAAAPGSVGVAAVLFGVAQGALHALKVLDNGKAADKEWRRVQVTGAAPTFTGAWQITPVLGPDWPVRPPGSGLELVVVESAGATKGAVWLGTVGAIDADRLTVIWQRLDATGTGAPGDAAALDVQPAATRFRVPSTRSQPAPESGHLWVAYARSIGDPKTRPVLHGLLHTVDGAVTHLSDGRPVGEKTALHANPAFLGVDGRPVTVGLGPGSREALVWLGPDEVTTTLLPDDTTTGRPIVVQTETRTKKGPELLLGGADERLFRAPLPLPQEVTFELHNAVLVESTEPAHQVEISTDFQDPGASRMVELGDGNRRIVQGDQRVYEVDQQPLEEGMKAIFLRYAEPTGPTYAGAFPDPDVRTELRLDGTDQVTDQGLRLIIDKASYRVVSISPYRVATLEPGVLGTGAAPRYRPARTVGAPRADSIQLWTLAELSVGELAASAFHFGVGTSPAPQEVRLKRSQGRSVWVLLGKAWVEAPTDTGSVRLPRSADGALTWTVAALERGYQNPELSWEYYDGQGWRRLEADFEDRTDNMSSTGDIVFVVPDNLSTIDIGGKDDYWIRARLIGGDYGRPKYVVSTDPAAAPAENATVQTVTVDTSDLRPPEILAIEAGFTLEDQRAAEIVLVENNRDVLDQTQAAVVPQARFDLFQGAVALDTAAAGRALYVGLSAPTGAGSLSLLADAVDQDGSGPLRVDLRMADGWRRVGVDDRTASLRRRGMLTIFLDVDPVVVRLFGQERVWLRLRPADGSGAGSWAPVLRGLFVNAVEVSQARTVENEILGSSLGEPELTVALAEVPVLPDTVHVRVRERLSDEERAALEAGSAGDRSDPVVLADDPRFPGTWVRWSRVDSLVDQPADARVYRLDPASGEVTFGDDRNGRIPPAGRDGIRAFGYQQGGGAAGNVAAWSEAKLTSAVEGVDTVVLPVDTAGGFGGSGTAQAVAAAALESLFATAPDRVRHAGWAMSPADMEALAVTSSTDIVRAQCARPAGPRQPITITIAVRDGTRRPVPTLARRDAVAAVLREAGWGGLGDGAIEVVGPAYLDVAVEVHLVAARSAVADVEQAARTILVDLLHPVEGGPDGSGWAFGRVPTSVDLLRALAEVDEIERVVSVAIIPTGGWSLDRPPVDGLVHADPTAITVVVTSGEGAET